MRIRLLGGLAVTDDSGQRVTTADDLPRRARRVLGVLAARYDRVQSKDALADAVWGDELPGNHVAALEHYVSVLRRRLQPGQPTADSFIVTRAGGYLFSTMRTGLDLAELRSTVRVADGHPPGSADRLRLREQVLELAVDLPFAEDEYADWAVAARDEVRTAIFTASAELAAGAVGADPEHALRLARTAIDLDPYVEQPYLSAMRACVALERPDDALRWFEKYRAVLDEQLGIAPSQTLRRLRQDIIRAGTPQAPPAFEPAGRPDAGPPEGPPGGGAPAFLGRGAELALIDSSAPAAVIHIVGPIGAGKSALLAELGRRRPGRIGIGRATGSVGALRLSWLRTALTGLRAATAPVGSGDRAGADAAAVLDRAMAERRSLTPRELESVADVFDAIGEPAFLAVDDAADLDADSVSELTWLIHRVPSLRVLVTYRYPSAIAGTPVAALDAALVIRLAPLTADDLGPGGDPDGTGGIPALVAVRGGDTAARATAMHIARVRTRFMPPVAWEILRLTAALGPLRVDQLARLSDAAVGDILAGVDQLLHAHLVVETGAGQIGHRAGHIRDAVAEQVSAAHGNHLRERLVAGAEA